MEIRVKDLIGQNLIFKKCSRYSNYYYLDGNSLRSEEMTLGELNSLERKNLFLKKGGIRFKFFPADSWEKIYEKLEKAKTEKKVFDSHGPLFDGLIHKACNYGYEYLHGAYGLGRASWYSYPKILILAKDGKLGFFGCNQWGEDLLFAFRCPKNWDNFQLIRQQERILESHIVAVSTYDTAKYPKQF